jgi:Alpha-2-macroglobulin family/Bacterial Alpha-2-macroglobulin MG10 domain/MG2 domain/A-macroglobulin TED domain
MAMLPLPTIRSPRWRQALVATSLGLCCLFLVTRSTGLWSPDPASKTAPPSLYSKIDPAHNPERLTLIADEQKIVGWISGVKDHSGEVVSVRIGRETEEVKIEPGNIFTWNYKVTKATRVHFTMAALQQSTMVQPREKAPSPSVFFLADRHVYRPGQKLHFAGFLRQLDEHGDFVPLTKKNVEVTLKTERKGTVVQRWKLTSDEMGRFTAEYPFVDADPLDNYELSIPDYQGRLKVNLAEYRKSKVQLRITAEQKDSEVKLRFAAVDFMDRPVPAKKVTFTAQVCLTSTPPSTGALKGEDFAHPSATANLAPRMDDLTEEEHLLLRGDPLFDLNAISGVLSAPTAVTTGEVNLAGKTTGEVTLNVPKACQQPGHAIFIEALLLDGSGREERRTQTIPLQFLSGQVKLSLSRPIYDLNEPIKVKLTTPDGKPVTGSATLVAMRLAQVPMPPWGWGFGLGGGFGVMGQFGFNQLGNAQFGINGGQNLGFGGRFGCFIGYPPGVQYPIGLANRVNNPGVWQTIEPTESVKRSLVTATAFKGDTATLELAEPGAYKLIAIIERPEGGKWQQEISCLVQGRTERNGVSLQLDRQSYRSGEALTGTLHSRFADAHVLLTVRDSRGVQIHRTLTTGKNGQAAIKEKLPIDIRFGCAITAQYANGPDMSDLNLATQTFHVEPTDRMLEIETKTKPIYGPSEKVVLDIQANRKESVDLIVSVYDASLKNIKPTQKSDIRSFYLADERAFDAQGRDVLQRCLAGVTIDSLLKKAKKIQDSLTTAQDEISNLPYTSLLENAKEKQFNLGNMITLLQLAGIKAVLSVPTSWDPGGNPAGLNNYRSPSGGRNATLMDLLNSRGDNQGEKMRISIGLLHDTFFLSEYNSDQPVRANARFYERRFNPFGGFQGGLGFGGMGAMNGAPTMLGQMGASVLPPGGRAGMAAMLGADKDQKDLFVRRDFSDSAYWNAKLRTDANGKARVEFQVPDSLTAWQVVVTGITKNMHVGQGTAAFQVAKPIMIGPILPRIFTEGDKIKVSAQVVNHSKEKQKLRVRLKVENGEVLDRPETEITLDPDGSQFVFWTFKPGSAGFTQLLMSAESPAGSDASLKRLPVVSASVEEAITKSGFCKDVATIEIPKGIDPRSAQLEVRLAPTLMADLVDTLDYLVDYPYGCAEQTMSRFLPAIKVSQALQHFEVENPALKEKLPGCVAGGIKRLLELQQQDGGWGWNGASEVHEMMTPYVLYGLLQAEKAGYQIGSEQAVTNGLNRVNQFIGKLKDKKFTTDRIFCMYVYGHRFPIQAEWWKEITDLGEKDKLSDQALGLALQMAVQHKIDKLAPQLAESLRKRAVQEHGMVFWKTAGFSRWRDDPLEITATVLKALITYDAGDPLIPGVLTYFNATKRGNRWNSTKDTAMIVEALCDYLGKQKLNPAEKLRLVLNVNDGQAKEVSFDSKALVHKLIVTGNELRPGENKVTFSEGTKGAMYRLILRHTVQGKDIPAKNQGLEVVREYWLLDGNGKRVRQVPPDGSITRGSYLECVIRANQQGVTEMRYLLLENPRPSCCEFVPEDDKRFTQTGTPYVLREERETHLACHFEQAPAEIENRCVLLAEIAGEFVAPPAQVELMYQTEIRGHSGTFRFKVVDR